MSSIGLLSHGLSLIFNYSKISVMAYAGSSINAEAEMTKTVIARLMSRQDGDVRELNALLTQIQTRNFNVQTIFFNVNWNVIITVSFFYVTPKQEKLNHFFICRQRRRLFHTWLLHVSWTHKIFIKKKNTNHYVLKRLIYKLVWIILLIANTDFFKSFEQSIK